MRYRATHVTTYRYQEPVAQCLTEVRLTPRSFPNQRVLYSNIIVDPPPALLERRQDYFGNEVAAFTVVRAHDRFTVTGDSIVEVTAPSPAPQPQLTWEAARGVLADHPDAVSLEAYEFVFDSPYVPVFDALAEYAKPSFSANRPLVDAVSELSHRIYEEFRYKPTSTSIDMPLNEVLAKRRGVCQDFAHIMIGALRSYHLAARYVSGYLRSGAKYQGAEASHAWVSVFIPGYGWMDLDPTNDVRPTDGHVTVAWGRDYGDVTPVKGISLGGGGQTVGVEV
ncbi:MAG: transglutaminase family protein, partial [Acidobacteriota bacterium]